MTKFYFLADCPRCDEEIYHGPCITFVDHGGYPVIPVDMMGQSVVDCPACGTRTFYGDLDYTYEAPQPHAPPDEVA